MVHVDQLEITEALFYFYECSSNMSVHPTKTQACMLKSVTDEGITPDAIKFIDKTFVKMLNGVDRSVSSSTFHLINNVTNPEGI